MYCTLPFWKSKQSLDSNKSKVGGTLESKVWLAQNPRAVAVKWWKKQTTRPSRTLSMQKLSRNCGFWAKLTSDCRKTNKSCNTPLIFSTMFIMKVVRSSLRFLEESSWTNFGVERVCLTFVSKSAKCIFRTWRCDLHCFFPAFITISVPFLKFDRLVIYYEIISILIKFYLLFNFINFYLYFNCLTFQSRHSCTKYSSPANADGIDPEPWLQR